MAELGKESMFRNVCFTLNNYTRKELTFLKENTTQHKKVRYLVFQEEIGEEEKTPHIQGYLELNDKTSFMMVKKILFGTKDSRVHLEKRIGTSKQASSYCKKEETRIDGTDTFEFGSITCPGKRTDLETICREIKEKGLTYAAEEHPGAFMRMSRGFKELDLYYKSQRPKVPSKIFWFFGPTGTGKSLTAYSMAPDAWDVYSSPPKWFNRYKGQEDVLIDNFSAEFCKFQKLLDFIDGPYRVAGFTFVPKRMIITSLRSPETVYPNLDAEDLKRLLRRIHVIRKFSSKGYKTLKNIEVGSDMPPEPQEADEEPVTQMNEEKSFEVETQSND